MSATPKSAATEAEPSAHVGAACERWPGGLCPRCGYRACMLVSPAQQAECGGCGAEGPAGTRAEAVAGWNRRPWRPIASAPQDGTEIILLQGERVGAACWVTWPQTPAEDEGAGWTIGYDGNEWSAPSHWMPLPPPPNPSARGEL